MAVSARVLSRLAHISGDNDAEIRYKNDADYLGDVNYLNKLHWSKKRQRFLSRFISAHCFLFVVSIPL